MSAGVLSTTFNSHGVAAHSLDQSAGRSVSVSAVRQTVAQSVPEIALQIHCSHSTMSITVKTLSVSTKLSQVLFNLKHSASLKQFGESVSCISISGVTHRYLRLNSVVSFTTNKYPEAEILTQLPKV
jgi:hypothetical protein